MNEEKDIVIRSARNKEIACYLTSKNELYHFEILHIEGENEDEDFIIENNDAYIYEVYKVLKEANEKGAFEKFKTSEIENEQKEVLV